jgi:hypothetical protein
MAKFEQHLIAGEITSLQACSKLPAGYPVTNAFGTIFFATRHFMP